MKKIKFPVFVLALMPLLSCSNLKDISIPLTEFRDCDKCPTMISLPLGEYRMGDLSNTGRKNERPIKNMKIRKPISISKFPVTVASQASELETMDLELFEIYELEGERALTPLIIVHCEN